MPEDDQLLLSPARAAARLEVGRSKIFELMATGEIESVRIGRSRRIPSESLRNYVRQLRAEQRSTGAA